MLDTGLKHRARFLQTLWGRHYFYPHFIEQLKGRNLSKVRSLANVWDLNPKPHETVREHFSFLPPWCGERAAWARSRRRKEELMQCIHLVSACCIPHGARSVLSGGEWHSPCSREFIRVKAKEDWAGLKNVGSGARLPAFKHRLDMRPWEITYFPCASVSPLQNGKSNSTW